MKIYSYLNPSICHIRHDHMPLYFMLKEFKNIEFDSNVNPDWMNELDLEKKDLKNIDVFITDFIDNFVKDFISKKKSKIFVYTDPSDGDLISDYVLKKFNVILKYQCNKIYNNYKNVFVPPYPFSGGLIPYKDVYEDIPFKDRDIDIFFLAGLSGDNEKNNIRARKVKELKNNFGNRFYGGINSEGFGDLSFPHLSQEEFWKVLKRSKISLSINRRETQMGMDRRLSEIWLSGSCAVTHPFGLVPHFYPKHMEHIIFTDNKMNNLCSIIHDVIDNIDILERIGKTGKECFLNIYLNQGKWFYNILCNFI
jgi:hypothetical protein